MKYETNFVKSMKFDVKYFRIRYTFIPVLKLITISQRKIVSEMTLKMIRVRERSSLKKEIATGRMMRLAMRRSSMQISQ